MLDYPRVDTTFRSVDAQGFKGVAGGRMSVASAPIASQTSTNLGCGFNPWVVGATAPVTGVPLGVHEITGQDVSGDVLSWFKAGIIANPSGFVLSLPGLGKSTLIRKQFIGAVAQGHVPIVAGDIKPEYVEVTRAMVCPDGRVGQVITLGHGRDQLNPLAAGALGSVIPKLEAHRDELRAAGKEGIIEATREAVHSRQVTMMVALVELIRGAPLADWEAMVLSVALRELRSSEGFSFEHPPLITDLVELIRRGNDTLRDKTVSRDQDHYERQVQTLVLSLNSLTDGSLGQIFAGHTTTPIDVSAPAICIDVSAVARGDKKLKAAVLLACWSDSYGAMEAAHVLADCGLAPQKYFLAILDELWQVLGAGAGMVQRVDELTRLNRTDGTGLLMITHTGRDLEALPNEVDVKTAMGFIERAGMVMCGGLPRGELDRLSGVLQFTSAEADMITSWSQGVPPDRTLAHEVSPPPLGRGRFMLKPSKDGSAGIPVRVILTPTENETRIHDTNVRFRQLLDDETIGVDEAEAS
ncbi:ATP/GTP-binding protein [Dietzia sp. 179-F 9C3 NHS]|uniref:ATP/GTP-binding protein n=1 Tax=Dietzia sp. 179-F 9C3 NHS TaxID=3374295 RepID=UPI003879BBD2